MILKNILILDGSYFLHRGLKQKDLFELRNSNLERTGAIYSFLNMLQKELKLYRGKGYPIICFDEGQSNRRLKLYENYKRHKEKLEDPERKPFQEMTEDELDEDYVYQYRTQRRKLIEVLNALGIPSLLFKGTEGDDLMYWLSKHCKNSIVFTDDRDLLQLLSDNCYVRQPMHKIEIHLDEFLKDNDFDTIYDFVKQKALCGDGSDNIPSACKGVGEKFALDCINVYEALEKNNQLSVLYDEKELKKYCNDNGFKYRKAYGNFDKNQYKINLELVDLNKIKDYELNEEKIYDAIRKVYKNNKITDALKLLNDLEIKTIDVNNIFESLSLSKFEIKE